MTGPIFYSLEHGDLRISRDDPRREWRGRIDAMPAVEVRPSVDGASAIVLLEPPSGASHVRNLVKVNADAEVLWRGELPGDGPSDCFVGFSAADDGDVVASTWSGYRVLLSGDTGVLLVRHFTK